MSFECTKATNYPCKHYVLQTVLTHTLFILPKHTIIHYSLYIIYLALGRHCRPCFLPMKFDRCNPMVIIHGFVGLATYLLPHFFIHHQLLTVHAFLASSINSNKPFMSTPFMGDQNLNTKRIFKKSPSETHSPMLAGILGRRFEPSPSHTCYHCCIIFSASSSS